MDARFVEYMRERDLCMDATYDCPYQWLRRAVNADKLSATNRTWGKSYQQLADAIAGSGRYEQVATVCVFRLGNNPRDGLVRGRRAGPRAIMDAAGGGLEGFKSYVRTMPCGESRHRMVLSREKMADAVPYVARKLAQLETVASETVASLEALQNQAIDYFLAVQQRKLKYHSLQIALDMYNLGLVEVADTSDCPLEAGAKRGLARIPGGTVKGLAALAGREAHEVQTALCGYNKAEKANWRGA